MYFVVYLLQLKKYAILPADWIKGIDDQFEKFVNNSINSSQKFLCFYTTNETAFINGEPDSNFEANFNLPLVTEINADGSFEGCFYGRLKHFNGKFVNLWKPNRLQIIFIEAKYF